MDDFHAVANKIEAAIWFAVALMLAAKSFWSHRRIRPILAVMAIVFVVFGVSDLVESQTGAWWRPPWLLAMKATCIIALAACFWKYFKSNGVGQS